LEIVDADGCVTMVLEAGADGPTIALKDPAGVIRAKLRLTKNGPMFVLYGETGTKRLACGVRDSEPRFELFDDDAVKRAVIAVVGAGKDLKTALVLLDEEGNRRLVAGLSEEPELCMNDRSEHVTWKAKKSDGK